MKVFVRQQKYTTNFEINNCLTGFLLVVLALFVMPLYAADFKRLFPGDIIDKREQAVDRENRASQRVWAYPQEMGKDAWTKTQQSQYLDNEHYIAIDGQPRSYDAHSNIGSLGYTQSGGYNYSEGNYNQFQNYGPVNKLSGQAHPDRAQNNSNAAPGQRLTGVQPYSEERFGNPYGNNNVSERSMPMERLPYPVNRSGRYRQRYPDVRYPGDVEAENRSNRQETEVQLYKPQKQKEHSQKKVQIRYIPVPVYPVPGTLPGTVPGVITPGNMVPGYSHLSPKYNSYGGMNNSFAPQYSPFGAHHSPFGPQYSPFGTQYSPFGTQYSPFGSKYSPFGAQYSPFAPQYSPLTGFGPFPGAGNPFGSVLNNNGNNYLNGRHFMTPNLMAPNISQ